MNITYDENVHLKLCSVNYNRVYNLTGKGEERCFIMLRGDRLRELREERGLTREELTAKLGWSTNQVYRYEAGINDATGKMIVKMARFFDVSADYLLGLSDERAHSPQYVLNMNIDLTEYFDDIQKNFNQRFTMTDIINEALTAAEKRDDSDELIELLRKMEASSLLDIPESDLDRVIKILQKIRSDRPDADSPDS